MLKELFSDAGVTLDLVDMARLPTDGSCSEEVVAHSRAPGAPTAWVACNHILLPYLLDALSGLRIPEDVSVVGYGDSIWAAAYRPPITVISHDTYREARSLTAMLLDSIDGKPLTSAHIDYRSRFIERESIGPAPR